LIDQFRKRCDFVDLVKAASKFARRNRGATILIENTANGPALLSTLTRKQQRLAHAITPRDSKTARFRRHYQKFVAGHIRILKGASFATKFIDEFVQFPHGPHNDQVDATTQFLDWIENRGDASPNAPAQLGLGVITRHSDSPSPGKPCLADSQGRGIIAISRSQIYNPPFPKVTASVIY